MSATPTVLVECTTPFPRAQFSVSLHTEGHTTHHTVAVPEAYYLALTQGAVSAERLVYDSFVYLLAREPATSILPLFELPAISQYFPEYQHDMRVQYEKIGEHEQ